AQPPGHEAAAHFDHTGGSGGYELVGLSWVDAYHDSALGAGCDGHVATNEKGKAAEHFLFGNLGAILDLGADARCQSFVVGHGIILANEVGGGGPGWGPGPPGRDGWVW